MLTQAEKDFLVNLVAGLDGLLNARIKQGAEFALDQAWGDDGNDVLGEGHNVTRSTVEMLVAQVIDEGLAIGVRELQEQIAKL